jgi:hypothetical protein
LFRSVQYSSHFSFPFLFSYSSFFLLAVHF